MTKAELIKQISDMPDDAEMMVVYADSLGTVVDNLIFVDDRGNHAYLYLRDWK